MELIYTNNNFIEQGAILDFELDLAYGKDENDYEITTPENEMEQGYYWFIKDTEYGGVVDEIEGTTNGYSVVFRGRTWQGILASYSAWQLVSNEFLVVEDDTILVAGKPYEIAKSIIEQLGLNITVEEPTTDEVVINETVERNLNIYQLMRYMFEKNGYKVKLYWEDGIVLSVEGAIDYASNQYYDTTQYRVKVDKKDIPNHLVGVFKRDEETNIIKHLYADEDGVIQPYYQLDTAHDIPMHDYEYERVSGTPVITGLNERVEVIEGGSKIENYDVVTPLSSTNGNTEFANGVPKDWNEKCYTDYYYLETDASGVPVVDSNGKPSYKNFEKELERVAFTVTTPSYGTETKTLDWWQNNWMTCYKQEQSGDLTQLSASDCPITTNWVEIRWTQDDFEYYRGNYYNFYYFVSSPDNYAQIEGKTVYDKVIQTKKGSAWNTDTGNFWFTWTRYKWKVTKFTSKDRKIDSQWVYQYSVDGTPTITTFNYYHTADGGAMKKKALCKAPQWKGGNFGKKIKIYNTPNGKQKKGASYIIVEPKKSAWSGDLDINTYCAITGKKVEDVRKNEWKAGTYWLRESRTTFPDKLPNPIYRKDEVVQSYPAIKDDDNNPIIYFYQEDREKPAYHQGEVYRKVEDNYTNLVKTMLDKYDEIKTNASVIEPQMNDDVMGFDVGDIIGSVHPFTNEQLQSKVAKKIVKGNSFSLTVSYEI